MLEDAVLLLPWLTQLATASPTWVNENLLLTTDFHILTMESSLVFSASIAHRDVLYNYLPAEEAHAVLTLEVETIYKGSIPSGRVLLLVGPVTLDTYLPGNADRILVFGDPAFFPITHGAGLAGLEEYAGIAVSDLPVMQDAVVPHLPYSYIGESGGRAQIAFQSTATEIVCSNGGITPADGTSTTIDACASALGVTAGTHGHGATIEGLQP